MQTPLQSTLYEVTGAGQTSARLFEGVKYGLTAGVSIDTGAGGPAADVRRDGHPGHVGHAVYLQPQNASGIGFHVVEVGTVSAGSTYSITHTPVR